MDKDTILKLSREENEGHDEMERSVLISSNNAAYLVGGFICVVILMKRKLKYQMEKPGRNTWNPGELR